MFNVTRALDLLKVQFKAPLPKNDLIVLEVMVFLGITFSYYMFTSLLMPCVRRVMILLGSPEWLIMPDYIYRRLYMSIWCVWWALLLSFKGEMLFSKDVHQFEIRKDVTIVFVFHSLYLAHHVWLGFSRKEMSVDFFRKAILLAFSCSSIFWQPYYGLLLLFLVYGVNTVLYVAQLSWCLQVLNRARPIGFPCWISTITYTVAWVFVYLVALPFLTESLYVDTLKMSNLESFFDLPWKVQYGFIVGAAYILIELCTVPTAIWCILLVEDAYNIFHMRSLERVLFTIPLIPRP